MGLKLRKDLFFIKKSNYLYIEPSSYCSLKCSRCIRTYDPKSFQKQHLDLNIFEKFIRMPFFKNIEYIEYGGNYGDPINHPKLVEFIKTSRARHPEAAQIIHTSGNQKKSWWQNTVKYLEPNDIVLFSIDGLSNTNHIYRVNSNWEWIIDAIKICTSKTKTVWKFIVFNHNESQIAEAVELAKKLKVTKFYLVKSGLFNGRWSKESPDPLAPSPFWMASWNTDRSDSIDPLCQKSSRHFLSANGNYSPCTWMALPHGFSVDLKEYFENENDYNTFFETPKFKKLMQSWETNPNSICKNKCSLKKATQDRTSHVFLPLDLTKNSKELCEEINKFKNLH